VNVRLIHEEALLGSAGTIAANRAWIGTDSSFWVLYSDVLTNMNLRRMGEFHRQNEDIATLGLYRVPDPSSCGVALTDEAGLITEFEEKPDAPRGDWVFSGIMVASPKLFDVIPPSVPADISFHVLPRLLGKMRAYRIDDYLLDIGTLSNYQKAQTSWPGDAGLVHPNQAGRSAPLRSLGSEHRSASKAARDPYE
jgi:mannose-1-phosphate guanylyltransferase